MITQREPEATPAPKRLWLTAGDILKLVEVHLSAQTTAEPGRSCLEFYSGTIWLTSCFCLPGPPFSFERKRISIRLSTASAMRRSIDRE